MKPDFKPLTTAKNIGSVHRLAPEETWPETFHVFEERDLQAIDAARAAGRPLLVKGEPGTG